MDHHFYKELMDRLYDGVYFMDNDRRILYWNRGAERVTGFKAEEVVGRHCRDHVLMHVDDKGTLLCESSLCPACKTMTDGKDREAEIYVHHKHGHRLPVLTRVRVLRNARGEIIGAMEVFTDNRHAEQTKKRIAELEKLALIDPLTRIGNRRFAEIQLQRSLSDMHRYGWLFAVFFMDIDHFKTINDTHGHHTGDRVLKTVSRTIVRSIRDSDILSRWGGEEFVVIVPNAVRDEIEIMGNKMRSLVEHSYIWKDSKPLQVTISVGGTAARLDDSPQTVIARADNLMYRSKESGRNRVTTDLTAD
ncbi:MAG: sensor domain-containing diguanylate cyclase [Desulfomonile tiedjei]|uniref:Sensor domain-containing diguanylate cyclase n=1 Tax=Desulfomonile tiedjei TaxID=2358 RepID=A0A9D6Z5J6_9BACT|nr:sensor domain-containing diguanylate cyclase [Desulfomonile tiedjei]